MHDTHVHPSISSINEAVFWCNDWSFINVWLGMLNFHREQPLLKPNICTARLSKPSCQTIRWRQLRSRTSYAIFVETKGFLDTFFTIPDAIVDHIFQQVCLKEYYGGSWWTAFPMSKKYLEKELYAPFVDAANFITGLCWTNPKFGPRWLSDPNCSPTSGCADAAEI